MWPADGELCRVEHGQRGISQAGELRSARLESVRAVAALGVLEGHIFGVAHGFGAAAYAGFFRRMLLGGGLGVFLFFALSGYLIYLPFARRDFGTGPDINLRRYARNRAVRILPLYYAVLVVLFVVQERGGTFAQWWRFLLFGESFFRRTVGTVDGPLWSLVVELHFYLLLPAFAWALGRVASRSPARAATVLAGVGALCLVLRVLLVEGNAHPDQRLTYSLPGTLLFFIPGMALAVARATWERRPPRWLAGPGGSTDLWLGGAVVLWAVIFWQYNLAPLAAVASLAVVGACALPLRPGGVLIRLLDWRPLAVIGVASYSLYIWHLPIVEHLAAGHLVAGFGPLFLLTFPLCCVVALISYRLIEAPFLRLRRPWAAGTAAVSGGKASTTVRGTSASGAAAELAVVPLPPG
jgi:peptidoglycan/LPS O-acetylase OafA/YrhL